MDRDLAQLLRQPSGSRGQHRPQLLVVAGPRVAERRADAGVRNHVGAIVRSRVRRLFIAKPLREVAARIAAEQTAQMSRDRLDDLRCCHVRAEDGSYGENGLANSDQSAFFSPIAMTLSA